MISDPNDHASVLKDRHLRTDFYARWRRARFDAISPFLDHWSQPTDASGNDEIDLLTRLPTEKRDAVLRLVFENSRRLGSSLRRWLGRGLGLTEISRLFDAAPVPCPRGSWRRREEGMALVRSRKQCAWAARLGAFACDFWREALDGMVLGATDEVRFARHASVPHGDDRCLDVLFAEAGDTGRRLSLPPVPADAKQRLDEIHQLFAAMKVELRVDGFGDGTLHYRLVPTNGTLCGASGRIYRDLLKREMTRRFGDVTLQDTSPRGVLDGD